MPFGPDRSELVPLSLLPQPRRPGLLQLLVALGRPAAAAAPGAVATFLVCAGPPSGSCPVPGRLSLAPPALLQYWLSRPCSLQLLAALGRRAAAPAAAPAAATFSSACAADVAVLHHSPWAGHPAPPAPHLPWLCRSCLLPLLDPSHMRDDRQATSCRLQPVLPWAQWPMAFSPIIAILPSLLRVPTTLQLCSSFLL